MRAVPIVCVRMFGGRVVEEGERREGKEEGTEEGEGGGRGRKKREGTK